MQIPEFRRKKSGDWILQFINIVFLILVFFMIEGVIATPPPLGINPPLVLLSDAASPPQNAVYMSVDGQLNFANKPLTVSEFEALLAQTRGSENAPQAIAADRRLPAVLLVKLMSGLQAKALPVLPLITLREEP